MVVEGGSSLLAIGRILNDGALENIPSFSVQCPKGDQVLRHAHRHVSGLYAEVEDAGVEIVGDGAVVARRWIFRGALPGITARRALALLQRSQPAQLPGSSSLASWKQSGSEFSWDSTRLPFWQRIQKGTQGMRP